VIYPRNVTTVSRRGCPRSGRSRRHLLTNQADGSRNGAGLNGEATRLKVYPAALDADGTIWVTLGK
jgi:hypothetical protein